MLDRFKGCMLGAAIGDSLGMPNERARRQTCRRCGTDTGGRIRGTQMRSCNRGNIRMIRAIILLVVQFEELPKEK
jgi:ADP-ribosylglycohydrolase